MYRHHIIQQDLEPLEAGKSFTLGWVQCGVGSLFWDWTTPGLSSSQPPEIPRWAWAFLDSLLVLGKHPRLPVDHAERGCFFTVGNDFMLKTLPPPGPRPPAFLLRRAAVMGAAWSRGTYLGHRKHYQILLLPRSACTGTVGLRCREGKRPAWDVGRGSSFSVYVCFLFGNNLQPVFPWNFNSVTSTNGSVLLRERR